MVAFLTHYISNACHSFPGVAIIMRAAPTYNHANENPAVPTPHHHILPYHRFKSIIDGGSFNHGRVSFLLEWHATPMQCTTMYTHYNFIYKYIYVRIRS